MSYSAVVRIGYAAVIVGGTVLASIRVPFPVLAGAILAGFVTIAGIVRRSPRLMADDLAVKADPVRRTREHRRDLGVLIAALVGSVVIGALIVLNDPSR